MRSDHLMYMSSISPSIRKLSAAVVASVREKEGMSVWNLAIRSSRLNNVVRMMMMYCCCVCVIIG